MSGCLVASLSLAGRRQQCNGHSLKQLGLSLDFHIHYVESKRILVLMEILELFLTNNEVCLDLNALTGLTHCCFHEKHGASPDQTRSGGEALPHLNLY